MSLFGRSSSNFDKYLEQATSNLLLEPDWTAVLNICDCIRQGDVQAKYAVSAIKKKLFNQNPHVALYALQVLESCVKNCGTPVHQEIVSRQFMEELRDLIKATLHEDVRNKILELIQTWAHAFRSEPNYRAVQDTVNLMKMEGFKFPVLRESDAMFAADIAPDWAEGECCHRCRVQFSVVNRKHHCRACGQIFCNKCSARNSAIPKYGIEKEVRVCEACWEKINRSASAATGKSSSGSGSEQSSPFSTQSATPPPAPSTGAGGKSEQELQEEEDLQLALALSKSEAENKEKKTGSFKSAVNKPANNEVELKKEDSADASELARYLNRSYWEQKQEEATQAPPQTRISPIPSAPATSSPSINNNNQIYSPLKANEIKSGNNDSDDLNDCVINLKSTLEIFVNRMQSNYSRGRPIANDTYVQSLFLTVTNMHSQLIKHIQKQDDGRVHFESLQDKLAQVRDARAALDALRDEHRERLRQEAEEAERQRQIQMAQKLDIMRKKKQEYLQYQRQIAMQRMQEQEREMQLRQEQQKYHMAMIQGGPQQQGPPPGMALPYQGVPYMRPPNQMNQQQQFQMGQTGPPPGQMGQTGPPGQMGGGAPSPLHRHIQQPYPGPPQQQFQQQNVPQMSPQNFQYMQQGGPQADVQRPQMHPSMMSPPGMGPPQQMGGPPPIQQMGGPQPNHQGLEEVHVNEAALISFD